MPISKRLKELVLEVSALEQANKADRQARDRAVAACDVSYGKLMEAGRKLGQEAFTSYESRQRLVEVDGRCFLLKRGQDEQAELIELTLEK